MKLEIINLNTIGNNIAEIEVTFNNDVISFKKLLNVFLDLKKEVKILDFNLNKKYEYDISFIKCNLIFIVSVEDNKILEEVEKEIRSTIKKIEEKEIKEVEEVEIFNNFYYNLKEEEKEIVTKFNKSIYFKRNEIDTKKVEILNNYLEEIEEEEKEINFKFPNLISSLIKNYKIGNLNKVLFEKKLANNKKLVNKTDNRRIIKLIKLLYRLLEEDKKEQLDCYILKDYKILDTTKEDYYRSFENLEILYKELNLKYFSLNYENENNFKSENNFKKDKDLINLVLSLH